MCVCEHYFVDCRFNFNFTFCRIVVLCYKNLLQLSFDKHITLYVKQHGYKTQPLRYDDSRAN